MEYWVYWNFPNCLGSLDGKHVVLRKPACSGSTYFNYKHTFSVILLALVDAQYRFLFIDTGSQGRCSDARVFAESELNHALMRNTINMPTTAVLPGTDQEFPYCIIGDDAFPLRETILKPYPHRQLSREQRMFNYRLSRARRCVENAFGILSSRFRFLLSPICLCPDKVDYLVLAACCLHNMLRTLVPGQYGCRHDEHRNNELTEQRPNIPGAVVASRRSATNNGKMYRDMLCDYFNSEAGAISWMDSVI
jgi:hypothetical protein